MVLFGLKLLYGIGVPVIAAVYWRVYGPSNFLWLSDIALGCTALALFTGHSIFASMPAVGVLVLETAWIVDFMSGGRLLGLAAYMYDASLPLYLRALSSFHLALPPTLIYLLDRLGYDQRALLGQTLITWLALILAYALTDPEKNINWVYGPGTERQTLLPPLLYLALEMIALPLVIFWPMHMLLKRIF
jgi:hypothetical protein